MQTIKQKRNMVSYGDQFYGPKPNFGGYGYETWPTTESSFGRFRQSRAATCILSPEGTFQDPAKCSNSCTTPSGDKWSCGANQTCSSSPTGADSERSCMTSCVVYPSAETALINALNSMSDAFNTNLMISQYTKPDNTVSWRSSSVYNFDDFITALSNVVKQGIGFQHFYAGDTSANGLKYGLVNVAAFIAQCMAETIMYDACDENNWSIGAGFQGWDPAAGVARDYPITSACGQAGQSYQNYVCSDTEKHMECAVDPNMKLKASTHAPWYGAPPPLFCAPKSATGSNLGFWDNESWCSTTGSKAGVTDIDDYITYMKTGSSCTNDLGAYAGQKAGKSNVSAAVMNCNPSDTTCVDPRTDVEGCCWWGRGVIQTSGPCNIGKLNYFLGKGASDRGADALYPSIDFCTTPGAICDPNSPGAIKWIAGMFYWINSVQSYDQGGWNYLTELKKFVNGGLINPATDAGFIHGVSGIVNRGCHNPPCGTGPLLKGPERAGFFCRALRVMNLTTTTCPPLPVT